MIDLAWYGWAILVVAALVIGMSKTALPGSGIVSVALFAAVLPAKQSTGTILLLLITADVFAVSMYRRHANWKVLVRLAPAVIVGVLLGVVFLAIADDAWVKKVIGVILLGVIALTLFRGRLGGDPSRSHRLAAAGYGTLAGFTTMVANAAGGVMSMYFLAVRFPVREFLGTAAWFFFLVNVSKVPFSIGLGLITPAGLWIDLLLVVPVVIGALVGRRIVDRLDQRLFDRLVIGFTVVGAVYLLVS